MKIYAGCSGWSYSSWLGHFYPAKLDSGKFLEYYSKVFDYVEIDSTFYRIPNLFMTQRWAKVTPAHFRFTAKFPGVITHEKRLGSGIEGDLNYFYESMKPLREKLLALLLQLPPSISAKEGLKKIETLPLDKHFRYAVEVRHKSWFDDTVYKSFKKNDICLVWNQLDEIKAPPVITTDFIYIRLIGDRSISETNFGKIQKDRLKEIQAWAKQVKNNEKKKNIQMAVVAANNHYAGFGPATSNTFRRLIGLPEVTWEEMKQTAFDAFSK